jgi:NADH:ubiquinone oxidoreductase subunit K
MQVICILMSNELHIHTLYLSTVLVSDKWRQTANGTEQKICSIEWK